VGQTKEQSNMKMYIAIRDSIPVGFAINSAGHASLIAYLKWHDDVDFQDWMLYSFKKVTCKVTDEEFEQLKCLDRVVVVTESALKGEEVAVVLAPRKKWPEIVRQLKLYE
jgi:peptidyl-tRNA hydrolase